ncbi:unnamed protein product [Ectocarpus sp. 6 AP-2014]
MLPILSQTKGKKTGCSLHGRVHEDYDVGRWGMVHALYVRGMAESGLVTIALSLLLLNSYIQARYGDSSRCGRSGFALPQPLAFFV